MSEGNKITKNLNVAEGANRSPGRKYPLSTEVHQESGGVKGYPNRRHRTEPSDKALENDYARKVGQWGVSVAVPSAARRMDLSLGSMNRGNVHGKNNTR
jgi:hypothetical protein